MANPLPVASTQTGFTTDKTSGLETPVITQPTTPAPAPTIAQLYGTENDSDKGVDSAVSTYGNAATAPVDEAAIRSNVMTNLQSEIDATNAVYAQKLKEAQIAGEGNLGSTAAINARRGLTGSDFAASNTDTTNQKNQDVYSGIGAEQAAAIAAINDKGNTEVQNELAAKNAVKQSSATDYINYLSQQGDRQTTRTNNAASAIISSGIDTTTLTPDDIAGIAKSYNISPTALTASLTSTKASMAAAAKANLVSAPVTDNVLQPDGKGGFTTIQKGAATPDSALKEYQYAVQNDGYTGSLADWNAEKANQKTSIGIKTDPLTGTQTTYERSGESVADLPADTSAPAAKSAPAASSAAPAVPVAPAASGGATSPYVPASLPPPANKVQLTYQKDFTSGKTATQVNALNTAVGHLFDANSIYSTINNGQIPGFNSVGAYLKSATGQAAVKNYQQAQSLVSDEIAGAYGADAASDRAKQQAIGSAVDSPDQHTGYVQTAAALLSSKIASNVQAYRTAMGQNPSSLDLFISPANQVKLAAMGINVSGLVPGLGSSSYAQSLISNSHVLKDGTVYIPVDPSNPKGQYQKLQ